MAWIATGVSALVACLLCAWSRRRNADAGSVSRAARFVLWVAIASPIPFLLLAAADRPRLLFAGPRGAFDGLPLLAFGAAAAGVVVSLWRVPRRAWGATLVVLTGSMAALVTAVVSIA